MLNTNSRIAAILTSSESNFTFVSPNFLLLELQNHRPRLERILELTTSEILELQHIVTRNIRFVPEAQIHSLCWIKADELTTKIDADDIAFIALALDFSCPVWTGDKKLLRNISGIDMLTTNQIWEIQNS